MRIARLIALTFAFVWASTLAASAHPLGNFTSNHLTRLTIAGDAVEAHYVLDDAEIPTFSLLRSLDSQGHPSAAVLAQWATAHAAEIAPLLALSLDGHPATWAVERAHVALRPGAGGLSTLYFTTDFRAPRPVATQRIAYTDLTLPGRIGWKDVVVAPHREPTNELRAYPNALVGSPRDRTAIVVDVSPSGTVSVADADAPAMLGVASAARMNALSDVLGRNLADPLVLLAALLLAVGLGALHALEPGHCKTLLAVTLVGARATVPQAAILAVALTLAHTLGVLAFGAVILSLARYVVPETLYPWIALASGAFVAFLGARALAREVARRRTPPEPRTIVRYHGYAGAHAHGHDHAGLDDEAHARAHAIEGTQPLNFRDALIAAASGNIAPCPAALVVLLAAIATHRVGYGLVLIVAFSVGLALTLTLLGIAVVRGAGWLTRRPQFDRVAKFAPLLTACAISVIGAGMIGEGVVARGDAASPLPIAALVLAAIAVFTIVRTTRHARLRKAIA